MVTWPVFSLVVYRSSLQYLGLCLGGKKAAALRSHNQFSVHINCIRSEGARM